MPEVTEDSAPATAPASPPLRSESGYRLYGDAARKRLWFILRGRELGFSIEELRSLLSLVDGGDYTCGEVHEMTVAHLDSVRTKIKDLRRLERTLGGDGSILGV